MRWLGQHIEELKELMKTKGFTGYFHCNTAYPGTLEESLKKHLEEMLQGQAHVPPFYLSTYSHWKDDQSPSIRCDFKTCYDKMEGFQIIKMDAQYASPTGVIKQIEIRPLQRNDIPQRDTVNDLLRPKKKRLRI